MTRFALPLRPLPDDADEFLRDLVAEARASGGDGGLLAEMTVYGADLEEDLDDAIPDPSPVPGGVP